MSLLRRSAIVGAGIPFMSLAFYQDLYQVQQYDTDADTDFIPTDLGAKLDTWVDPSLIAAENLTGENLNTIPEYNTNNFTQITEEINVGSGAYEDAVIGVYAGANNPAGFGHKYFGDVYTDWDKFQNKAIRFHQRSVYRRDSTVENPTYIEGFCVIYNTHTLDETTESVAGVIYAHRMEGTRLIQIVYNHTNKSVQFQIRGSGNVIQTLETAVIELAGLILIHFRFDKTNNDHYLNANGLIATSNYNFGVETFNSTAEVIGGYENFATKDAVPQTVHARGFEGFLYELILCKGTKLTSTEINNVKRYLEKKYLWEQ